MLLHQFLEQTARRSPDQVALVCRGTSYTYRQIDEAAARLGAAMQHRGVRRGDRVAIFLDNSVESVVSVYGTLKIGAVFMPVNALTKTDKLGYMLNDARAACLVTHTALRGIWDEALARSTSVRACIVVGGEIGESGADRFLSYRRATATGGMMRIEPTIDQDLASIIYTSGTTGDPKGVMLTHLNMVTAVNSVSGYLGYREDDVILCVLPLAFSYGLYQVLIGFKVGAKVVLEQNFAFPVQVLEVMRRERVTVLPGVPTIFTLLMAIKTLSQYDLRPLRMITNAAAALSEEHIRQLRGLFPQAALYSMYGLTECKRVTYLPPDQLEVRPTSVGRGMPNQEVWLVDELGRRLPNGSTGELVVRGSHVMRGYWEKPAETAERLKPGPIPGERVLYSGDIFRTDSEGYLYFVARKGDVIKSRGEKVSPREVENALYSLPGVLEAAVVGVPDAMLGQAVKAFVVIKSAHRYSDRDVIKHCLTKLENFMVPKYVEFVDSIPKTDTGKIKKTGLA
jgi:amino acid adenylation domain-containing protein